MTFEVLIRDLRIGADIGAYAHEVGREQPLTISARLAVLPPVLDLITETIDYNVVVDFALALGRQHIALIETFAWRLAEACLDHPHVVEVEIIVEKPGALANGIPAARVVLGGHRMTLPI